MNILIPDSWLRQYLKTDATPAQLQEYLSLCGPSVEKVTKVTDDFIYDIEITTNRIDMVSVYGIAREASAILPRFGIRAHLLPLKLSKPTKPHQELPIEIKDPDHLCDRLLAVVLDNLNIGQSPVFLKDRLEKAGIRSLNNIIDITNYVMLEVGHPCHVFDYDRIKKKKLILRKAKKGEKLITLDNKECDLTAQDVVIDDGTGEIIDLPGIMGTKNSVVTNRTKRILFFIESNNPYNIRKTSMRLSLRSQAATINEKHPDPQTAMTTLLRGIKLFEDTTHARVSGTIIDIYPNKPKQTIITTDIDFINNRLGIELKRKEITDILHSLSFEIQESTSSLRITAPSFRQFDITIPEDIVEEVARIYGYHKLPTRIMAGDIPVTSYPIDLPVEYNLKQILKYLGFTETYTYSFISKDIIQNAKLKTNDHLHLSNPLTNEIEYMRISLVPSLLDTIYKNQTIKESLNFFEIAKVYLPQKNNLPKEDSMLTIATHQDFYHLKGVIEYIFDELGVEKYQTMEGGSSFLHPKQSVTLKIGEDVIGYLGSVHPSLYHSFDLTKPVCVADINLQKLLPYIHEVKRYTPIPMYPPLYEDFALKIPKMTKLGHVIDAMKHSNPLITKAEPFDSYDEYITLRITYQDPSKNLSQNDIVPVRKSVLEMLRRKFSISLRS